MLFNLPDVLCLEVLSQWSETKSIGKFDSAICNRNLRPQFLTMLSSRRQFHIAAGRNNVFMMWIKLRNVKPVSVEFYKTDVLISLR